MPPNHFESEVESFLEGSHGDRTHIKRADHHTVTPLCGTLLRFHVSHRQRQQCGRTTSRRAKHTPAPRPTGVKGAGATGGPGRGAGGRGGAWAGNIQTPRPIGGRCEACGAWPDIETTHRAGAAGVKGAGGTGGPGRGAGGRRQGQGGPRDRPLRAVRLACGDLAGGPPPTSTHSGQAHRQTIRRPEHQRRQSTTATG